MADESCGTFPDVNERITRLEEKVAFLEHHVTEQDKAMLQLVEDLTRLRRELKQLSSRFNAADTDVTAEPASEPERPPHY